MANASKKPMGITERKTMMSLVDNQFQVLRSEVEVYASELKRQHIRRIEEEYAEQERLAQAAVEEWNALQADIKRQVDEFLRRKREAGLIYRSEVSRYGMERNGTAPVAFGSVGFQVAEKARALTNVANDVDHQVMKVRNDLDRQRLELHHEILLEGVSDERKKMLDKMPDAKEILTQAVQDNPRLREVEAIAQQQVQGRVAIPAGAEPGVHIPEVIDVNDIEI